MSAPLPSIALIAHDAKKDDLVAFAVQHKDTLGRFHLIATGTTGGRIQQATGLQIECLLSGPLGGDLQIGSRIACGEVHMVIFLRDPLTAHAHEPDISALVKICDIRNIAIATNLSSANILVRSLQENV